METSSLSSVILPLMNKPVLLLLRQNSGLIINHGKIIQGILRGFKCKTSDSSKSNSLIHLRVWSPEREFWVPVNEVADIYEPVQ